ncbi:hypothetical protein UlMin_025437 [Ulmus minor]
METNLYLHFADLGFPRLYEVNHNRTGESECGPSRGECHSKVASFQVNAISMSEKKTLFIDVLSIKEHPKEVLLQVLPEESDVLCTHPMFGPESGRNRWKDLTFVYERGCQMLEISCEEHDKLACRSQFLTQTIGRILSEMEIRSTPMNTKGFETLIQLLENLELAFKKVKQKLLDKMIDVQDADRVKL